jgi:hypothetical protein
MLGSPRMRVCRRRRPSLICHQRSLYGASMPSEAVHLIKITLSVWPASSVHACGSDAPLFRSKSRSQHADIMPPVPEAACVARQSTALTSPTHKVTTRPSKPTARRATEIVINDFDVREATPPCHIDQHVHAAPAREPQAETYLRSAFGAPRRSPKSIALCRFIAMAMIYGFGNG